MSNHGLSVSLGNKTDLEWAQETVTEKHYLRRRVDPRARPMVYVVRGNSGSRLGLVMVGIPHATKNRGWWGYPGLPTQWQVVDLCRIWIDPSLQQGGSLALLGQVPGFIDRKGVFRPTVATWAMSQVLDQVQMDRISLWPPVFIEQPYHIQLAISYHDPAFHKGAIYRVMGWQPMYTDGEGAALPGRSGKVGWCWPLSQPDWSWQEVKIAKPRTLRMVFG